MKIREPWYHPRDWLEIVGWENDKVLGCVVQHVSSWGDEVDFREGSRWDVERRRKSKTVQL